MKTEILYEDADILVIYKPAGIATQSARIGQQDAASELKNYIRQAERRSGRSGKAEPYLGVIHRLDQPVEGLLAFARNRKAASVLNRQLQERQAPAIPPRQQEQEISAGTVGRQGQGGATDGGGQRVLEAAAGLGRQPKTQDQESVPGFCKYYYAVLFGLPKEETGELEDWLCKRGDRAEITGKAPDARLARLRYSVLQSLERQNIALADIWLETGRFHQIRAQMAYNGMPLLGDLKYGSEASRELSGKLGIRNVALCAYRLEFIHPVTGKKMHFAVKPRGTAFSFFSQL